MSAPYPPRQTDMHLSDPESRDSVGRGPMTGTVEE